VLEITARDREALRFRFLGANDDPNYEIRLGITQKKAAERSRRYRAAHSTGRRRGRPGLSQEEKRERKTAKRRSDGVVPRAEYLAAHSKSRTEPWKALNMSKAKYYRLGLHTAPEVRQVCPEIASRDISNNRKRDGISVPHLSQPVDQARAPQARGHLPIVVRGEVLEGEIVVDSGVGLRPPPPTHLERAIAYVRRQQQAGMQ
jgi:hypothetical protein